MTTTPEFRLLRCRHCGLLYKDPWPAEIVRHHYEHVYAHAAVSGRIDHRHREVFERFLGGVPPFGGRRLLDVGCGSGEFLDLARKHGWTPAGVEVSPSGAALARRRDLPVHETLGDLPDEAFDAVTLWNVVDFFARPVEQMEEIRRILAPGGLVFVRTPNAIFQVAAWRLSRAVVWPRALARLVADGHYFQPTVWGPSALRLLLRRAGFTDVRVRNSPASLGDPYRGVSAGRDRLIDGVKGVVDAVAGGLQRASRGRLTVAASLAAVARKSA
jgi:SAM-dependent methyltransferase